MQNITVVFNTQLWFVCFARWLKAKAADWADFRLPAFGAVRPGRDPGRFSSKSASCLQAPLVPQKAIAANRVVVLDDHVSSLDSDILFIASSLIKAILTRSAPVARSSKCSC
ncbi:AAA family ATPase [Duganella sp. HH101]|uniref:AAA family ATPase n=1 Tax=Duganella sp. HH101 TaxID=1781066 RepID=UPI0008FC66BC|nr:AAA family ATPase [Duganella sp. HH101]